MYTRTTEELEALLQVGLQCESAQSILASCAPNVKDAAIAVPGGRWLLVPMNTGRGGMFFFDLTAPRDEATTPRIMCQTQNYDLSTVSFSGMQLETDSPTSAFTFAQVYRVYEDREDPAESPWLLHVWRVQEISDTLHAECLQTMQLGSLEDSEARIALYRGSLRDDMLAFSIDMESDDFSVVMVANWKEVGDDAEKYEGKIFPRIGDRQQFESLALLSDSRVLLSSASGQLSTIHYESLNASIYPEYDGSSMAEAEVVQMPPSTSTDTPSKERVSARSVDTASSNTMFPTYTMASQRAIQCQ